MVHGKGYRAAGQSHLGLILVSTKTFPQNRGLPGTITTALATPTGGRLPVMDRDYPEQLLAREPAPPYAVHLALLAAGHGLNGRVQRFPAAQRRASS